MNTLKINPFDYFTGVNGSLLENGYIYVGKAGLDPETNPITVYSDAAKTVSVTQPIRTTAGYFTSTGNTATFFANENYSIRVKNKDLVTLFTITSFSASRSNTPFDLQLFASNNFIVTGTTENQTWATAFQENVKQRCLGLKNRGEWLTGTVYSIQDTFTKDGVAYICIVTHTSSALATDVSSGRWAVYQGVTKNELGGANGASFIGYGTTNVKANLDIITDFKASRWHFYDFSSGATSSNGGFSTSLISAGTLANNTVIIDGAYGAATFSSSTTANSGGAVNETAATPLSAGLVTRSMFYLAATQATRVIRMGFTASGVYVSAAENNGVYCEVLDNVVKAWTSTGGTTTSQGSANIPTGALITCDVEIKSATNVRLVVFNSVTLVKYLDETITTNIPAFTTTLTLPCLKAWSTGTTAVELVTVDYIGVGPARPTYIKTPV